MTKYLYVLLGLTLLFVASGCGDDKVADTDKNPIDTTHTVVDHAEFMFFHAASTAPAVNIKVDTPAVMTDRSFSILYGDGYTTVNAGSHLLIAAATGGTDVLATGTFTFDKDEHYTLFLVNEPTKLGFLRFHDDLTAPPEGKALIRIANLIPDAPAVKMAVPGSGNGPIFTNVKFMDTTELFTPINAGTMNFRIQNAASGSGGGGGGGGAMGLFADIPAMLEAGKIYTIALVGSVTDKTATGVIVEHKHD